VPWAPDGKRWECEVCSQTVCGPGRWCDLYVRERGLCRPLAKMLLGDAHATGDGSFVNALCQYGRRKWGEDIDW
jgi:hypothetical protein